MSLNTIISLFNTGPEDFKAKFIQVEVPSLRIFSQFDFQNIGVDDKVSIHTEIEDLQRRENVKIVILNKLYGFMVNVLLNDSDRKIEIKVIGDKGVYFILY